MPLDVSTITLAGAILSFVGALFLVLLWTHERSARTALWWAGASCGKGIGLALLAFHALLPPQVPQGVAPIFLNVSALLTWIAARIFTRSVSPWPIVLVFGTWLAAAAVTGMFARQQILDTMGCSFTGGLFLAAAIAVWRGRSEHLRARAPMIAILAIYALALFMLAVQKLNATMVQSVPALDWLGIVPFIDIIYSVGVTSCLVMMLKERNDAALKVAALTDPLTGLANRRAFMDRAQRLLEKTERENEPLHLLAFDLDHFKKINDTFGHAAGDEVLRIFAKTLSQVLRPTDLAARLGGEEFVAAIPGCDPDAILAIAERIRCTFQDNNRFVSGAEIGATVSAGVAVAKGNDRNVAALIAQADAALYRAKDRGRNCVVLADENPPDSLFISSAVSASSDNTCAIDVTAA